MKDLAAGEVGFLHGQPRLLSKRGGSHDTYRNTTTDI
jgi:hypothetical protein